MALLKTPLLSAEATGQIGRSLIFATTSGQRRVRSYARPTNPNTPAQQAARQRLSTISAFYGALVGGVMAAAAWRDQAGRYGTHYTNHSAFVRWCQDPYDRGQPALVMTTIDPIGSTHVYVNFRELFTQALNQQSLQLAYDVGPAPGRWVNTGLENLDPGQSGIGIPVAIFPADPAYFIVRHNTTLLTPVCIWRASYHT